MDTKKYTIVVDGVQEAIESVKSLKEVIEGVSASVTASVKTEEAATSAKKEHATATDELGKVQQKLNDYDEAYATEVAKAKAQLKSKNDEVKNALKFEQDLQVVEAASMNTYKEKQTYLSALNRVIRNMTDEETVNGKTKEDWIKISAEVQQSLKDEDEQMKIYTRNVGNYKSAVEDLEEPHKSLKAEMKELKNEMARMLADGISPLDEGFKAMAERAGAIKDAIGDAGAEIDHFASDTAAMDNVVNVATTATAAYGLMTSSLQMLGVENESVLEGIQKLEAAQTALNSLNSLSSSLLDNSTASYKIYHTILQAVGLEKKANAVATTTLSAAETAEAATATTAASATAAFAASLWAVLSPLLVIVATVALVAAGIYGLVAAYEALFGPTDEETAAMEAQCQKMSELNSKTAENIDLLKAKSDEEAEVINAALEAYQKNITALAAHVEQCKEFYGEDSDEYKAALEEKEKAELEYEKFQNDGLTYLTKIAHKAREKDKEETMGKFDYQRKKAEESYNFQVKLLKSLIKQGKIAADQEKQMLADLQLAYKQAQAEIDKNEKDSKSKTTSTRSTNITRGTGGSSQKSDAEKAAKEFKKSAEEITKAIAEMEKNTNKAIIDRNKELLEKTQKSLNELNGETKEAYQEKLKMLYAANTEEINILSQEHSLELQADEEKWLAIQEKYKKHTDLLLKYQQLYEEQRLLKEQKYQRKLDELSENADKKQEEAEKEYAKNTAKKLYDDEAKVAAKIANSIDSVFTKMLNTSGQSLAQLQTLYSDNIAQISEDIDKKSNVWAKFWELPPDADKWSEKFDDVIKSGQKLSDFLEEQHKIATGLVDEAANSSVQMTNFQKSILNFYAESLKSVINLEEKLRTEGKSEEEVQKEQLAAYQALGNQMGSYRQQLIEAGKIVGDFKEELNALGEKVEVIPTNGLQKSEKAAKKWGTSIKKFLNKYVEPFKDAFDKLGETINGVFDAMNDWIQVDIDKLADALEEITEKYDELSEAVENTEDTISSLKEEFKSASSSDKTALAQKIADEEALLAQEKAAQQEAFNEQQRLDEQKEELENEQAKRQLSQQQVSAGISLINALINTAEGMSKEYSKGILGIPTAVLIGVLGGIQVAAITAQIAALQAQKSRYAEGGYVNGDGMLQGPTHAEGGIDIRVGKSRVIEAEGGEFIINRKSSAKYYDLLTEINDYGKTGKQITGLNRRKFANGGSLNFERVNDTLSDKQTEKQMQRAMENVVINPKVSVVDIIRKTNDYNRVRTYAGR